MAKRKYLYKNIKLVQYGGGYRPYYVYSDGTEELLSVAMRTRELAYAMGKRQVDYMNRKEN